MSAEERAIELEIKVTYQEKLLAELNEVVTEQTKTIDLLEKRVDRLERQLRALADGDEATDA